MRTRLHLEGAKELEKALGEIGVEMAEKVGRAAVRKAAQGFREGLKEAAPYNPAGPTPKVYTAKDGSVRRTDYGHLRDNLRVRYEKTREPYMVRYLVTIGRAFWGYFLEVGTVRMRPRPWARPAFDRGQESMVKAMMAELRAGLARAQRRIARGGRRKPGIGRNGGPAMGD